MIKRKLTVSILGIVAAFGIAGNLSAKENKKAMKHPSPEEMMKKMQEFGTPGMEHEQLKKMLGKFKVTTKMTMDPTKPAEVTEGMAEGNMILDGHFVELTHQGKTGKMMGEKDFKGISTLGYDKVAKKYTATWKDNMSTAQHNYTGTMTGNMLNITSEQFQCPMDGTMKTSKGTYTFKDDKTFTYEETIMADGKPMKVLEVTYTRM